MKVQWFNADDPLPRRKPKPKPNPLDDHEGYLQIKNAIMNSKFRPMQSVGMFISEEEARKMGVKAPWRVAVDRLRKLVKSLGLQSDYRIIKYHTDTPGVWFVRVTYEPPITVQKGTPPSQMLHTGVPPRRKRKAG